MKHFTIHGYFEEFMRETPSGWQFVGQRRIETPPAGPLGAASQREFTATAPLQLTKGCGDKTVVQASAAKPVKLIVRTYPICGRLA